MTRRSRSRTRTSPRCGRSSCGTSRVDVAARPRRRSPSTTCDVPEPRAARRGCATALEAAVGAEHVSTDALDRVVHARGKSLRDLVRHRRGELGRLPDVVVRPGGEATVEAVLQAALDGRRRRDPVRRRLEHLGQPRGAAGRARAPSSRSTSAGWTACSRSTPASRLARGAGRRVRARSSRSSSTRAGWTLGHFPDSFTHSTLGGWIATRSSGMQSDKYGDIADLTRGLRVVTPARRARRSGPCPAPRPGRACARWCSAARAGSGSSPRRRSTCTALPARARDPRLPVPDLGGRAGGDARHRRRRGGAVGDARVRAPTRRSSRSRRARRSTPLDRAEVARR